MDSGLYLSAGLWELFLKPSLLLGRGLWPPTYMRLDSEQGGHGSESYLCLHGVLLGAGFLEKAWGMRGHTPHQRDESCPEV